MFLVLNFDAKLKFCDIFWSSNFKNEWI